MGLTQAGVSRSLQVGVNFFHGGGWGSVGTALRHLQLLDCLGLPPGSAQLNTGTWLWPWGLGLWSGCAPDLCRAVSLLGFSLRPSVTFAPHLDPQSHCSASPSP